MCSVVGYIGSNKSRAVVLEGLSRLEYRGYDSAGFACLMPGNHELAYEKAEGQLSNLVKKIDLHPIDGNVGVGHTRWSTHGVSSYINAHPQLDCLKKISVVHNGIIENYSELKKQLISQGHIFVSQTDTEVLAHLFEDILLAGGNLRIKVAQLLTRLEGAYAIVIISQEHPDFMIVARKGPSLCIGIGLDEMFVASDPFAFAGKTDKIVFLPDEHFAFVRRGGIEVVDFQGNISKPRVQELTISWDNQEKKGFEHFMLKEIYEQKGAIHATLAWLRSLGDNVWQQCGIDRDRVRSLDSFAIIGCGTSWHAGRIGQFFFEHVAKIPTSVALASEFRYMSFFPKLKGVYIAISQSGETADTLEAAKLIAKTGVPLIAVTNVVSGTLAREASGSLLTHAGPEVAVASTKAFTTQLIVLYWLAHRVAFERNTISQHEFDRCYEDVALAAEVLEASIENYKYDITHAYAPRYAQFKRFIFLGRHISYPFALEAALKLKEISYIFAQCYPAGELKHGPIALVDGETPVVIFSTIDEIIYQKLLSNAQEVKARKGHIIAFVFEGQHELEGLADVAFVIPRVNPLLAPLAMTGLMQFFVYEIAKVLGCAIDKPRNLAKSVTVE